MAQRTCVFIALMLLLPVRASPPTQASGTAPRRSALVTVAGPSVAAQIAVRSSALGRFPEAAISTAAEPGSMLAGAEEDVRAQQDRVVAAAERIGVEVISRYTTAANGLLVHATAAQLRALALVPGVIRVEAAPQLRASLDHSVRFVGAEAVMQALGYDGEGTVVAIVDSGIDYTHAGLGGPGSREAYQAAAGAAEIITDSWQGALLFPTGKVVGGYDFVGPNYTTPERCGPADEAAGKCTSTPHPDPDPLDQFGHGTVVAGIAAGEGTEHVHHGVAPGARLVALKVYGPPGAGLGVDEAADVAIDAIEWCTRVNLGLPVPGTAPDHVDVINMSFGESYGQGSRLFDQAVAAAAEAGIVVVASAGNSGARPYVLCAPSASPLAVSVAGSLPPGQLKVAARWDGGEEQYDALEGTITVPLWRMGLLTGELAWHGRGCEGDEVPQPTAGKIALISAGRCSFREKILNAQSAGAMAVVMYADAGDRSVMTGDRTGIAMAGVMIDSDDGIALRDLLLGGTTVTVVLDPAGDSADTVWSGSSRGPSKNGALKPDITAPAAGVSSTALGSGDDRTSSAGTSVASPFVAGAAALLRQRSKTEESALSALDVAALLLNYARPYVHVPSDGDSPPVPVARQGAGRLDVLEAARGSVLVRTGDIASVNLGPLSLYRTESPAATLHLRNLSPEPMRLSLGVEHRRPSDAGGPLRIRLPVEPVRLAGNGALDVTAAFEIDPRRLPEWSVKGQSYASSQALDALELDGWISLTPLAADGAPLPDTTPSRVPFYALPRRASRVFSSLFEPPSGGADGRLLFQNVSTFAGQVELFAVPEGATEPDPDEPDVLDEADLRLLGARFEAGGDGGDDHRLTFGIALHGVAAIPQVMSFEVYADTDLDGRADYRVRTGTRGTIGGQGSADAMVVAVGEWQGDTGTVVDEEIVGYQPTDLHSRVAVFSTPIGALGLSEPAAFDFYVVSRGLTEDWLAASPTDVAPDGAEEPGGARYRFDPAALAYRPKEWTITAAGQAIGSTAMLEAGGSRGDPLLALYPDNQFEWSGAQAALVRPGSRPAPFPGPRPIFVPVVVRDHSIRAGPDPDQIVREALDKLVPVQLARMTHDLRNRRDPGRNGWREFKFDVPRNSVYTIISWEAGHRIERMRRDNMGYISEYQSRVWRCGHVDEDTPLWHEMIDRLRREFPPQGWRYDEPMVTEYGGRKVWQVVRMVPEAQGEAKAYVDQETGMPAMLRYLEGNPLSPDLKRIYMPYDFDSPDIVVKTPRYPCP